MPKQVPTAEHTATHMPTTDVSAAGNLQKAAIDKSDGHKQMSLQCKLSIGSVNEPLETEADSMADKVMRMPEPAFVQRKCANCEEEEVRRKPLASFIQKKGNDSGMIASDTVTQQINSSRGRGSRMDGGTQSFMESRFGTDFSGVSIHTSSEAVQMSRELNAKAFTVGNDVYFNEGQYNPGTAEGKHLLAHELTHTVQQGSGTHTVQRYTDAERREMAERRVAGQQADIDMANARSFQSGDIVFRSGSTGLAFVSGQPVTHGGIYIGQGLIHDAVGFGNRNVRVTNFYNPALAEAANGSIYRVIRFIGPQAPLIITRLLSNINAGNFRMPTDPVPFNLFSTADDYRTATCLEYAHAQFLHAIQQLALDPAVSETDRQLLRQTYFVGTAAQPSALINPQEQRLLGNMPSMAVPSFSDQNGAFPTTPPRTMSASVQAQALISAATLLATDVNPSRFSNRNESRYRQEWSAPLGTGWFGSLFSTMLYDEVLLRTFTYQSFVDSRRFFTLAASSPG